MMWILIIVEVTAFEKLIHHILAIILLLMI